MSIRVRLAIWCAGISCILLAAVGLAVFTIHSQAHYGDVDRTLAAMTEHFRVEIDRQLARGAPLDRALLAEIDAAGPQLVGANLALIDPAGNAISGRALAADALGRDAAPAHDPMTFATVAEDEGRVRVHTMPLTAAGTTVGYVQSSVSLADLDRSLARFRVLLVGAMVAGVVLSGLGSLVTAARALQPVFTLTETARAIALSRAFGRRIEPSDARDELGELARTFNEMLGSLQSAHEGQRRFIDDAAHELRAPLTSIAGNLDLLERALDLPASERVAIEADIRREVDRLGRLVNDLLALARADAGQAVARESVELDRIVIDEVRQMRRLANGVALAITGVEPTVVLGDIDRLRQLVVVLIDNALRYTPAGGGVEVGLRRADGEALVSVVDTGIGIAAEELPRIFDRFYRTDPARDRDAGGSGLGLAIAGWIAEAHGGRIEVASTPGAGSRFTVALPLAVPAAGPAADPAREPGPGSVPSGDLRPAEILPAASPFPKA